MRPGLESGPAEAADRGRRVDEVGRQTEPVVVELAAVGDLVIAERGDEDDAGVELLFGVGLGDAGEEVAGEFGVVEAEHVEELGVLGQLGFVFGLDRGLLVASCRSGAAGTKVPKPLARVGRLPLLKFRPAATASGNWMLLRV